MRFLLRLFLTIVILILFCGISIGTAYPWIPNITNDVARRLVTMGWGILWVIPEAIVLTFMLIYTE